MKIEHPSIINPPEVTQIKLISLKCVSSADNNSDDTFINFQCDGHINQRIPVKGANKASSIEMMTDGDVWSLNEVVSFYHDLQVVIWDLDAFDDPSSDTFLANFDFLPHPPGAATWTAAMSNSNGAKYKIQYQFLDQTNS